MLKNIEAGILYYDMLMHITIHTFMMAYPPCILHRAVHMWYAHFISQKIESVASF